MVSEHAARAWKRFSTVLGALADVGLGVGTHGAGHGSSAEAQSFQNPRHADDPALRVFASNQTLATGLANRGGCALVRPSRRNFCPDAIALRKRPTGKMEGAWTNFRKGQCWTALASIQ